MSTRPRRQSAADGGRPLGLELPGPYVDGEPYWPLKRRWLAGERLSPEAMAYIGAGVADLSRPRVGAWRQPTQLPAWSEVPDVDEYEEAPGDDLRIVMSIGTTKRLEEEAPRGRGAGR